MSKRSSLHSDVNTKSFVKTNYLENSLNLKQIKLPNDNKPKPFKIPDGKVLVNKKLLWTYEMDKKLLDLYNKNGAHWLLISTVMEKTVGCGDNYFNTISVKQRVEYLLTQLHKNSNDTKKKELKEPDFYSYLYETSKFNGVSPKSLQGKENKENFQPAAKVQKTSLNNSSEGNVRFKIEPQNSSNPVCLIDKNNMQQTQPLTSRPIVPIKISEDKHPNTNIINEEDFMYEIECSDPQNHFSGSTGSSSPLDYEQQQHQQLHNSHRSQNDIFDFDNEFEKRLNDSESLFTSEFDSTENLAPELESSSIIQPIQPAPHPVISLTPSFSKGEEGSSYRKMIMMSKQKPPDYYQKSIFQANNGKKDLLKLPTKFPLHPRETKEYKFRRVLQTFSDDNWRLVVYREEPSTTFLFNSARRLLEDFEVISKPTSVFF